VLLVDHDTANDTNLNRMVGLTKKDVDIEAPKTEVMKRLVKSINPDTDVQPFPVQWQYCTEHLKRCTAIFGCVDSYGQRDQLERFARRHMIPYIDVGMDVHGSNGAFHLTGQVILSLSGQACMRCMGFITEELLAKEAQAYGAAGGKPQVVWPNGVLASTAVGQLISLLTPWHPDLSPSLYLEYDGNRFTVSPSQKLTYIDRASCTHFSGADTLGDITW
jgi:molybdopterin-synthase adenylyltransferase